MTATDRGERCLVSGRRPEGFRLFAGFVGNAEQRDIERWILDNFAWEERRHGPLPPCEQYPQDGPIPAWAVALGERMTAMGIFASSPDHVLLRRYDRGRGVRPHIDRVAYGPVVAGLTLVSSRMFHLAGEEILRGTFTSTDELVERISRVTDEQVRDVARRYLDPGRWTLTALGPAPSGPLGPDDWPAEPAAMHG